MTNDFHFKGLKTPEDLDQAQALLASQIGSTRFVQAHFNWDSQKLMQLFRMPGMVFWGGYAKDHLIVLICVQGLAVHREVTDLASSSSQFDIYLVLTHEKARRTGAAALALESFVRKECKSGDVLWLEVHEQNTAAVKFYEKMGFQIDGYRKNYYIDGGRAINMSRFVG